MANQNKYPVVLLHGMFGFGEQQVTNNFLPYFGLWNTNIKKMFEAEGIRTVAPSMGPFTSAWNRACEIYAQLFGGTVDYGKAHSEKYGCERYGRTYEALLPEWGTKDKDGNLIKINIIGHSFGGVSGRMLNYLMTYGSAEERAATDAEDLSPLFAGGHGGWVHSITTLASPHNGMTSVEGKVGKAMETICLFLVDIVSMLDATSLRRFYDLQLDQYGINAKPDQKVNPWKFLDSKKVGMYFFKDDNIVYDLTLEGAEKLNALIPVEPNVYYFSFRGGRTRNIPNTYYHIPEPKAFPLLNILGFFMGIQQSGCPDEKTWHENDMVINTVSAEAPTGAPRTDYGKPAVGFDYKPGVFNVFKKEHKDHMSYCGWMENHKEYAKFYQTIYDMVSSLPTID